MFKKQKTLNMGLLVILYDFFKLAKTKGDLALESHVESPEFSELFPKEILSKDELEFVCDLGRLLTLGTSNQDELDRLMGVDITNRTFLKPFRKQRYNAIREAFYAHCAGYAPQISVEFARKAFHYCVRPNFHNLESALTNGMDNFLSCHLGVDVKKRKEELREKQSDRWGRNTFSFAPNALDNPTLDEDFDEDDDDLPSGMEDILKSIRRILGAEGKQKPAVPAAAGNTDLDDEELMREWNELAKKDEK